MSSRDTAAPPIVSCRGEQTSLVVSGSPSTPGFDSLVVDAARRALEQRDPYVGMLTVDATYRWPLPVNAPQYDRDSVVVWRDSTPSLSSIAARLAVALRESGLLSSCASIVEMRPRKINVDADRLWTGAQITLDPAGALCL